MILRNLNKK